MARTHGHFTKIGKISILLGKWILRTSRKDLSIKSRPFNFALSQNCGATCGLARPSPPFNRSNQLSRKKKKKWILRDEIDIASIRFSRDLKKREKKSKFNYQTTILFKKRTPFGSSNPKLIN